MDAIKKLLTEAMAEAAPTLKQLGLDPRKAVMGAAGFTATVIFFLLLRRLLRPKKRSGVRDETRVLEQCLTEQSLKIIRLENEARKQAERFERRLAAAERRAADAEAALERLGVRPPGNMDDPPE